MAEKATGKAVLHLAGRKKGLPTLDELLTMFEKLTGRKATPAEREESRKILDEK